MICLSTNTFFKSLVWVYRRSRHHKQGVDNRRSSWNFFSFSVDIWSICVLQPVLTGFWLVRRRPRAADLITAADLLPSACRVLVCSLAVFTWRTEIWYACCLPAGHAVLVFPSKLNSFHTITELAPDRRLEPVVSWNIIEFVQTAIWIFFFWFSDLRWSSFSHLWEVNNLTVYWLKQNWRCLVFFSAPLFWWSFPMTGTSDLWEK